MISTGEFDVCKLRCPELPKFWPTTLAYFRESTSWDSGDNKTEINIVIIPERSVSELVSPGLKLMYLNSHPRLVRLDIDILTSRNGKRWATISHAPNI